MHLPSKAVSQSSFKKSISFTYLHKDHLHYRDDNHEGISFLALKQEKKILIWEIVCVDKEYQWMLPVERSWVIFAWFDTVAILYDFAQKLCDWDMIWYFCE